VAPKDKDMMQFKKEIKLFQILDFVKKQLFQKYFLEQAK
jgi:hypothetical protein